jgi:hypothetical protein
MSLGEFPKPISIGKPGPGAARASKEESAGAGAAA